MKKIRIVIFLLLLCVKGFSQQRPLINQYMLNPYFINPAAAGHQGYTTINLSARQQWLGIPDAPSTKMLSFDSRILKRSFIIKTRNLRNRDFKPSRSGRVGIGGYIYNDINGHVERNGIQLTYAYHIFLNMTQLSFGLSASTYQFRINHEVLSFYDNQRERFANGALNHAIYIPDFNFGVLLSNYKFYSGLSVDQLIQSNVQFGNSVLKDYRTYRQYYLMGGYRIDFRNEILFEPSVLIKANEKLTLQADMGCKVFFNEEYWGGLAFRSNGSIVVLTGIKVNKLYFGYSFDYPFTHNIGRYSYGSHEINISVKLGDSARRYRWLIRY